MLLPASRKSVLITGEIILNMPGQREDLSTSTDIPFVVDGYSER